MKEVTKMYRELIKKRLDRKKSQLDELIKIIKGDGEATSVEKRKYIETKAVVQELENILDISETMFDKDSEKEK